ncbi:MAG: M1 family metallopeptidase [Bacteroidota bacterium]
MRYPIRFFIFFLVHIALINPNLLSSQQTDVVDYKRIQADLSFSYENKSAYGEVTVEFQILEKTDSVYLDAIDLKLSTAPNLLAEKESQNRMINHRVSKDKLWFYSDFEKGKTYAIKFDYQMQPKKALYFTNDQIWTQGQGKYTSNWLPSIDDVNDKIEFDLALTYNEDYKIVANGKKEEGSILDNNDSLKLTKYFFDMKQPMPSYLVALAIGNYQKKKITAASGVPIELYYYPKDSLKFEPTYRHTKVMFDFMEAEIGVSFPWQNYKQVPVHDFLYAGMENTTLTIFSDSYVVDSIGYNDKNYITVNAHELAHQWFGNYVTATSSEHHWLQEGFATYYALLAERHIFGDDHYYWQLFEYAQELIAQEEAGGSTSLLNPKSSSITFYKKGAWALHILRELVGDNNYRKSVQSYLNKHAFGNVKTSDFISEVETISKFDLKEFRTKWLDNPELPEDDIVQSLKKSKFMQEYFNINCTEYSVDCKDYFRLNVSDKAKIKVISQIPNEVDATAFDNSLEVRRAISRYVQKIPTSIKADYESLLDDKSYVTIENALYNLWANFPQDRARYLQKTKDVIGFNDKNVRLLWLALHLNTVEYQAERKQDVLNELLSYTAPDEHFELRLNAFNYVKLLGAWDRSVIESLVQAKTHPVWQFSKFAKNLLAELKNTPELASLIDEVENKSN